MRRHHVPGTIEWSVSSGRAPTAERAGTLGYRSRPARRRRRPPPAARRRRRRYIDLSVISAAVTRPPRPQFTTINGDFNLVLNDDVWARRRGCRRHRAELWLIQMAPRPPTGRAAPAEHPPSIPDGRQLQPYIQPVDQATTSWQLTTPGYWRLCFHSPLFERHTEMVIFHNDDARHQRELFFVVFPFETRK